jgi:hypothetical protein
MAATPSLCDGCGRETTTVHGKCANCWYVKHPSGVPARRKYQAPLWDGSDLTEFVWGWASWAPGLAALVLGLVLDIPALIVVGGCLLAVRLLGPLILDYW